MQAPDLDALYGADMRRANRRRFLVFLGVFLFALAVGQIWNFSRAPEYRAGARLQITPPVLNVNEPRSGDSEQAFLTEVQTLGSRPLIEQVAMRLRAGGYDIDSLGLDPVLALQSAMTINRVAGTQVVELEAFGRRPELPAALLAGTVEAYREHVVRAYRDSSDEATARVDEEVAKLEAAVAEKRKAIEEFRIRNQIVSPEREENSVLAEMQGLAGAQKEASKRLIDAEGRVEALRAAAAAGKPAVRASDHPNLVALETRAAQLRAQVRELGRRYTPQYLDANPDARDLRNQLAETEEQIRARRSVGQKLALEEAEQDLAEARETSRHLQEQIERNRRRAGDFAARFGQYKSLQDDLAQLQKTYQDAQQRQARLGASERSRQPVLQVLEPPAIPKEPWRPLYWRDAVVVGAAALVLALLAMWLVELFNRPHPRPSVLIAQPVWTGALPAAPSRPELGAGGMRVGLPLDERQQLPGPSLPRELTVDEATALLRAADPDTATAVVLLLAGLTPDEALSLRRSDVGDGATEVRVSGVQPRQVPIPAGALRLRAEPQVDPGAHVLAGPAATGPTDPEQLSRRLLVAAHDAGLNDAHEVTPEALRHTYIAFLVRQGARFADITRRVGALDADALAMYSRFAPAGPRIESEAVRTTYPALESAGGH